MVEFDFKDTNAVMRLLKQNQAKILATDYLETNSIVFQIKKQHSEQLEKKFEDIYASKLKFMSMH